MVRMGKREASQARTLKWVVGPLVVTAGAVLTQPSASLSCRNQPETNLMSSHGGSSRDLEFASGPGFFARQAP